MMTRNYGSMHDEIIRYVASTILVVMSVQGNPMTERQIKGEVTYLPYVPEALEYLQERGLIRHLAIDMAFDVYYAPLDVGSEVLRVCTCAIKDNEKLLSNFQGYVEKYKLKDQGDKDDK